VQRNSFFLSLALFVLLLSALIYFIHTIDIYKPYSGLSFTAIGILTLLNIVFYFLAYYFSKHSADQRYLLMVYANMGIKFILIIGLAVAFYFYYHKPNGNFVVPYLIVYITFTIYETWMLNKMAVMRK
jgi:F0F1-type ATP synthase assembly protein I